MPRNYTIDTALSRIEELAAMLSSVAIMAANDNEQLLTTNADYGMYEMCVDIETLAHSILDTLQQTKSYLSLELVESDEDEPEDDEDEEEDAQDESEDEDETEHEGKGKDAANKALTKGAAALEKAKRSFEKAVRAKKTR